MEANDGFLALDLVNDVGGAGFTKAADGRCPKRAPSRSIAIRERRLFSPT
jgi:hypothetical protein